MPDLPTIARWARKATSLPPRETLRRAQAKLRGSTAETKRRRADLSRSTYEIGRDIAQLAPLFVEPELAGIPVVVGPLAAAATRALRHEFDLLGSGGVRVAHGSSCPGLAGHRYPPGASVHPDREGSWLDKRTTEANGPEARRVWSLVDDGYEPIDWQLDFRSGWRWSQLTWYRDIKYLGISGGDPKVPWELGRLQHLPQLALAALAARRGDAGFEGAEVYTREIRNQLLDFIATNPPRFGVQWVLAIDCGIRLVNILLARGFLEVGGMLFDNEADAVIRRSVFEHSRCVAENLEWDPNLRGNHYLADLVGLAFGAAALADEPEAAGWMATAAHELNAELGLQFNADGTNFEGSIPYHRLSSELAIFGTALLLGRGQVSTPAGPIVAGAARFSSYVTGPDSTVAQIGDNDSGRLVKLTPDGPGAAVMQAHLIDAAAALLDLPDLAIRDPGVDRVVVRALARGIRLPAERPHQASGVIGSRAILDSIVASIRELPAASRAAYRIPAERLLEGPVELGAFPDGGYWVARSARMHLVIRCGSIGQRGNGGHDHDDQLAFDLWLDGEHLLADPGAYVYAPLPVERNRYRAAAAHTGPLVDGPSAVGLDQLFRLEGATPATCLAWGGFGFAGRHVDRLGRERLEVITWSADGISIEHGVRGAELAMARRSSDWRVLRPAVPFSPGYGLKASE